MIYDLSKEESKARFYFDKLVEKKSIIELKERKEKRTLNQNSYLHVLFSLFGIETGYTLNESKQIIKGNCQFMIYEKSGKAFLKSTADLDTKEMTDFITWFRNYAGMNGIYLPTPEEYQKGHLDYEKVIEQNKRYL